MVREGYKQTELGEIPEDWDVKCLGQLCNYQNGTALEKFFNNHAGYLVISIGNYSEIGKFVHTNSFIDKQHTDKLRKFVLNKNDLTIILNDKTSIGTIIGRVLLIDEGESYIFNQRTMRLTAKDAVDSTYLFHNINSKGTHRRIVGLAKPGTQIYINTDDVLELPLILPTSITEQQAIAKALSDVDGLIDGLTKLIAKKQDIKTGTMQQLLTGKTRLPGFGEGKGYKQTELGVIPEDWEVVEISNIIENYFCGPSPTCEERNIHDDNEWGVLKTTASTVGGGWNWRKHKVLPKAFWNKRDIELQVGDVIVTKAGPRHRVGIAVSIDYIPKRVVPSGKMIALRPKLNKVNSYMLSAAIMGKCSQNYLNQRTTGMAEAQLNYENNDLISAPVVLPKLQEQRAITTTLANMDKELKSLQTRLNKTKSIKQGMMQELLTGKTRLI